MQCPLVGLVLLALYDVSFACLAFYRYSEPALSGLLFFILQYSSVSVRIVRLLHAVNRKPDQELMPGKKLTPLLI